MLDEDGKTHDMHPMDRLYECMSKDDINLAGLDLNLITALHALLEHQSVSEAAKAVGRTQSAMSHSLSRLRDHFRDPVLVRDGWSMRPTPLAERLRPRVLEAAHAARAVFENEAAFDPATSERRIRIAAPDLCASLFAGVIGVVSRQAPGITVEFVAAPSARKSVLGLDADIGLAFGRPKSDPNLIVQPIPSLDWCTFAPLDHPYAQRPTKEVWGAAAHVMVGHDGPREGPVEKANRKHGLTRHISCFAPNFHAALALAQDSGALFTTLRAPFEPTARRLGLVPCPTPFPMEDAPAALLFREDHGDTYQRWLRDLVEATLG